KNEYDMTRLLVTGGSGFIGINLINALCDKGIQLLNIDKSRPLVESHQKYWKNIDILDHMQFEAEVLKFDPEVIIHLAAVTDLNGKTLDYYKTNIKGIENLIYICA